MRKWNVDNNENWKLIESSEVDRPWRKDMLATIWEDYATPSTFRVHIFRSTISAAHLVKQSGFATPEEAMHWADMYILTQGIKP